MGRATRILMIYIAGLLIFSLFFSWLNLKNFYIPFNNSSLEIRPMMLVTIIGGVLALKLTVSPGALKVFLLIYISLWALRYLLLYIAIHLGQVNIFGKIFHFDIIVPGYYKTVSRLETPLPFVTFWLINHLFAHHKKAEGPGNT